MKLQVILLAVSLLVSVLFNTGCETPTNSNKVYICTADEIRNGDTLRISLLDIPGELHDKEFTVRSDGTVNLPYVNSIKASGKKFGDFEREVQKTYLEKKIFGQITVIVKAGDRFYSVGGEVKAAGRQLYTGDTTVLRAIVTCGDFNEYANRSKVEIIRANGEREVMNCNKARQNPALDRPICPGDAIFVPKSL